MMSKIRFRHTRQCLTFETLMLQVLALLSTGGILWVVGAAGVFKALTFGIGKTSKMSRYNMPPMKSHA